MPSDPIYVNIHTEANPGGEIRGQVNAPMPRFNANLNSWQEVDPLDLPGMGFGDFKFNPITGELQYHIEVDRDSLTGPIATADIHNAPPGQNGGVVKPLTFVDGVAEGVWRPSDADPLTMALVFEIRGQILSRFNHHVADLEGG